MSRLVKTILFAAIGALIGYAFFSGVGGQSHVEPMFIVAFMGFPAGWSFFSRTTGHTFIIGGLLGIIWFVIKVMLCVFIGWIITPIEIIRGIVEICQGASRRKAIRMEEQEEEEYYRNQEEEYRRNQEAEYNCRFVNTAVPAGFQKAAIPEAARQTCFCEWCGNVVSTQAKFCTSCGKQMANWRSMIPVRRNPVREYAR